jgi:hypothetical protein
VGQEKSTRQPNRENLKPEDKWVDNLYTKQTNPFKEWFQDGKRKRF